MSVEIRAHSSAPVGPRSAFRTDNMGTVLVAIGMFLSPLSALQPITPPPVVTFADLFLVVGFMLLTPSLARGRLQAPIPYVIGALLLLTTSLLSAAVNADPAVSVPAVIRLTYAAILLPVAFLLWRPSPGRVTLLAGAYVVGSCFSLVFGLFDGPTAEGRYLGLSPHPNAFGHSMAFGVMLIPFLVARMPARRWWWYAAGAACCYGIWISGSRASLVAFVLIAVVYVVNERSVRATAVLLYAGVIFAIVWGLVVAASGNNAFARLLGAGSASDSDGQRVLRFNNAIAEMSKHPLLGDGFEQGREAHNIYLQVATGAGVFGLFGFLLMLSALALPAFRSRGAVHYLAYPALVFVVVGPLTDVLWDTLAWAVVSLGMLARDRSEAGGSTTFEHGNDEHARATGVD